MVGHAFVIACVVIFPILGWWQWERSQEATGGLQNFGYALQWPAFAIILICVWVKAMRDEFGHDEKRNDGDNTGGRTEGKSPARRLSKKETRPVQGISLAARPAAVPGEPGAAWDEEDEEVAAYNRYLASLSAQRGELQARRERVSH